MNNNTGKEAQESYSKSKRDFLKYILGGSIAAWAISVLYPIFAYLKPPKQAEVVVTSVKAGKVNDFEKDSGKIIRFGDIPVMLVRTSGGDFRAFSAICTHLGCTVQYRKDMELIWCACHNGKYDLNGRNAGGPPPKPLDEYRVVIQNDEVLISKMS
jgi:cytochrome b6-f complex iron-sulfur subunit